MSLVLGETQYLLFVCFICGSHLIVSSVLSVLVISIIKVETWCIEIHSMMYLLIILNLPLSLHFQLYLIPVFRWLTSMDCINQVLLPFSYWLKWPVGGTKMSLVQEKKEAGVFISLVHSLCLSAWGHNSCWMALLGTLRNIKWPFPILASCCYPRMPQHPFCFLLTLSFVSLSLTDSVLSSPLKGLFPAVTLFPNEPKGERMVQCPHGFLLGFATCLLGIRKFSNLGSLYSWLLAHSLRGIEYLVVWWGEHNADLRKIRHMWKLTFLHNPWGTKDSMREIENILNWIKMKTKHKTYDMKLLSGWTSNLCVSMLSFVQLWDPMDSSSSVHGIILARILEWFAISSSRGSSWLGNEPMSPASVGGFFYHWAIWEASMSNI